MDKLQLVSMKLNFDLGRAAAMRGKLNFTLQLPARQRHAGASLLEGQASEDAARSKRDRLQRDHSQLVDEPRSKATVSVGQRAAKKPKQEASLLAVKKYPKRTVQGIDAQPVTQASTPAFAYPEELLPKRPTRTLEEEHKTGEVLGELTKKLHEMEAQLSMRKAEYQALEADAQTVLNVYKMNLAKCRHLELEIQRQKSGPKKMLTAKRRSSRNKQQRKKKTKHHDNDDDDDGNYQDEIGLNSEVSSRRYVRKSKRAKKQRTLLGPDYGPHLQQALDLVDELMAMDAAYHFLQPVPRVTTLFETIRESVFCCRE